MEIFLPDKYYKDIYSINYKKLKEQGIKCLLFDLDNTLVPVHATKPNKKLKDFINNLKELELKIIIVSNSKKKRLEPFKKELNVDCSYTSIKPFTFKFKKIIKLYKYDLSEIAMIGDQLLTDVLGANIMGITSILINPMSRKDIMFTKFNRKIEKFIERKLLKRELFKRGKYYD